MFLLPFHCNKIKSKPIRRRVKCQLYFVPERPPSLFLSPRAFRGLPASRPADGWKQSSVSYEPRPATHATTLLRRVHPPLRPCSPSLATRVGLSLTRMILTGHITSAQPSSRKPQKKKRKKKPAKEKTIRPKKDSQQKVSSNQENDHPAKKKTIRPKKASQPRKKRTC